MEKKTILIIVGVVAALFLCCCCLVAGVGVYLYNSGELDQYLNPGSDVEPTPSIEIDPQTFETPAVQDFPTTPPEVMPGLVRQWDFTLPEEWSEGRSDSDYNLVDKNVENGKYVWHIEAKQAGNHQTYLTDLPEGTIPADYYQVTVEAQRLSGIESAAYGIVFNYIDGDHFVTFLANDLGNCLLSQRANGQWVDLGGGVQTTDAIRSGEVNVMSVKVSGNAIYGYINGQLVIQVEDLQGTTTPAGTIGLTAELYDAGDQADFAYDNFAVLHPASFSK